MKKYCSIFFLLLACADAPVNQNTTPVIPQNSSAKSYTYFALGDSYTIGQNVPEKDRWSNQLANLLQNKGYQLDKVDILAQTGWTTDELTTAFEQSTFKNKQYDMVSLLIGVNNQYRGQSVERFRAEFAHLLTIATQLARNNTKRVFVLTIPDWGVTPFGNNANQGKVASEIDSFNKVLKEECLKVGIVVIDITPISRTALNDASMIASDQLHFSGKMYDLWARAALPTTEGMLSN